MSDIMSRTQSNEFCSALERAGLTVAEGQQVIGSKDNVLAKSVVGHIRGGLPAPLAELRTGNGCTRQEIQLANFRLWNQSWGGFFYQDQLHQAMVTSPFYSWEEPTGMAVLCWAANHLEQTMEMVFSAGRRVYGDKLYVSPDLRIDKEHLTIADGAPKFEPNRLWWEVLDGNANRDTSPLDAPMATAAGTEVFQAAVHHPGYLLGMNGNDRPYWDVPALRAKVPGDSKPYAPYVDGYSDGEVFFNVDRASNASSHYAEVAVQGVQS